MKKERIMVDGKLVNIHSEKELEKANKMLDSDKRLSNALAKVQELSAKVLVLEDALKKAEVALGIKVEESKVLAGKVEQLLKEVSEMKPMVAEVKPKKGKSK